MTTFDVASAITDNRAADSMRWRVFVADTRTGSVLTGKPIPFEKLPRAQRRINASGFLSIRVPYCAEWTHDDMTSVSDPWRWCFGLAYGQYVAQAGPLIERPEFDPDTQTWSLHCAGIWKLLSDKRVMLNPGWTGERLPHSSADLSYTGLSLHDIARAVVSDDISRTDSALPIDLPGQDFLGGHERNWPSSKLDYVGNRLTDMTDDETGSEIEFSPYLSDDLRTLRYDMRIGWPHLGELNAEWLFSRRTTLVSFAIAGGTSRVADNYFAVGAGSDVDLSIGMALSTRLSGAGYTRLDDIDTAHMQATDLTTLDGYAGKSASRYVDGSRLARAVCRVDNRGPGGQPTASPGLESVRLGDRVLIDPSPPGEDARYLYRGRLLGLSPVDAANVEYEVQILEEVRV